MKFLIPLCQILIGCGLLNVWLLRFNQATAYRGGVAKSMLEEFAAYGFPGWFCYFIGVLKVGAALCLLAGLVVPALVTPAAALIAALMAGALIMHIKVRDPWKKSLPAFCLLLLCLVILLGSRLA
jgi:hypothetical protein